MKNHIPDKRKIILALFLAALVLTVVLSAYTAYAEEGQGEKDEVVSIEYAGGIKTVYRIGEMLDLSGGKLTVNHKGGEREEVVLGADMVSGFDSSKEGTFKLKITYGGKTAEVAYTVKKPVALSITSDKYTVEIQYVTGISPGTTVSEFLSHINERDNVRVLDGEAKVEGDPYVRTGMKIDLLYPDSGDIVQTLTLSVVGDVNGDGKASLTDLLMVVSHLNGGKRLTGARERSAALTNKTEIIKEDVSAFENVVLGRTKLGG